MNYRFKEIIAAIGLKNKELARELGITPAAVSDIVNGRVKNISGSLLILLQLKFNINPDWLLTGEGDMSNTPSDVKDGKVNYTSITDINEITRTKWFKNLSKEQREIITHLASVKDRGILKKVSDIMSRQSAKEKGDLELEELDRELNRK
jgi:transcriptional regulator with XRE-family HTH domain